MQRRELERDLSEFCRARSRNDTCFDPLAVTAEQD